MFAKLAGAFQPSMGTHENIARWTEIKGVSERSFGFTFAVVFGIVGLWPLLHKHPVRLWAVCVGAAFFGITLVKPSLLKPLNRVWTLLGALLHRIMSPIISGLVFFTAVTPTALIVRWMGKDLLRLAKDEGAQSYWLTREPPGPEPGSMINQF